MKRRTPPSREGKLEHILRSAAQVFAERGFAGASVRDISRATGVSLSGLYYYFDSKQTLLYLIQKETFTRVLESAKARLAGVHDPVLRLRGLVRNHVEYFLSHPNEMKVLSHEDQALQGPKAEEVAAIKRRYYALAREIFDTVAGGHAAGGIQPRLAVLSLFGMMNWVYKWHKANVDPGAEELTDAIVGIFLHGVLPAGREQRAAHQKAPIPPAAANPVVALSDSD